MNDYSTLPALLSDNIECFVFDTLPSTNDYLSHLALVDKIQVCITNTQTEGKGQYKRQWLSKKGGSITLSVRYILPKNTALSGLSLVIGLAIKNVLSQYNIDHLMLKWPNDVYCQGQKLAGILIENAIQGKAQSVVIGVGVNVDLDEDFILDKPWISLKQLTKMPINRLTLSKNLIDKILEYLALFKQNGFSYFHSKWKNVDYLSGKHIQYKDLKKPFQGVCAGVDKYGVLLVKTKYGMRKIHSSQFLHLC